MSNTVRLLPHRNSLLNGCCESTQSETLRRHRYPDSTLSTQTHPLSAPNLLLDQSQLVAIALTMMFRRVGKIDDLDLLRDGINYHVPLFQVTVVNAFSMDSK